jgi:hypothetical protein
MRWCLGVFLLHSSAPCPAGDLRLPERSPAALTGSALAGSLLHLSVLQREEAVFAEVKSGNIPSFLRTFVPLRLSGRARGSSHLAELRVMPEYLALGSDSDYLLIPLTPACAQKIADFLGCALPTRKIVDTIYARATVHLLPLPFPWTPASMGVAEFARHGDSIRAYRNADPHVAGALVAGHKKDIILSPRISVPASPHEPPFPVVIYGWHRREGDPIQPVFAGHAGSYADYSHGVRLVKNEIQLDGTPTTIQAILVDSTLAPLLSDEGMIPVPRYPTGLSPGRGYEEEDIRTFRFRGDVSVTVNTPGNSGFNRHLPTTLILYALPNGNSTAQTAGKRVAGGEDWHFGIQHIAAQTRFVRAMLPGRRIAVAYLEADGRSWPAWRSRHPDGNAVIARLLDTLRQLAGTRTDAVILGGHSGGGSFLFGVIDGAREIPDDITRIAFLDATYAYGDSAHGDKLERWLRSRDDHVLCVFAYDDSTALLNSKPFVSATGGTWYRSHLLLRRLGAAFPLTETADGTLRRVTGLAGRIQFYLKENPDRAILHTVQVEKNGFIHALLAGGEDDEHGYRYLGDRAYDQYIDAEEMKDRAAGATYRGGE